MGEVLPPNWGDSVAKAGRTVPKQQPPRDLDIVPEHPTEELNLLSDHDLDAVADRVVGRFIERFPLIRQFEEG